MKPLDEFIAEYIDGEPLTTDTVKWAIKKYIYMSATPTPVEKTDIYERFLKQFHDALVADNQEKIKHLQENIFYLINSKECEISDEHEKKSLINEALYNLLK